MSGTSSNNQRRAPKEKPPGDARGADDCDLSFTEQLSGLRPSVRLLVVGDVLEVSLETDDGMEAVTCRRKAERDVVGSLAAFEGLSKLIVCMRKGNEYTAEVRVVSRTSCAVHVRRSSR